MTDSKTPEWVKYEAEKLAKESVREAFRDPLMPMYIPMVPMLSQALLSAYERGRAERAAEIAVAEQALKDWLHVYAPDLCDATEVEKAKARIGEHGTIAYIARALAALAPPATAIRQRLEVKG